jgi:hypothetical protein
MTDESDVKVVSYEDVGEIRLSVEDIKPVLNLSLKARQVSHFEAVTVRTVNRWIKGSEFLEYTILPGKNEVRIPLWSYLEFRRRRRVRGQSNLENGGES